MTQPSRFDRIRQTIAGWLFLLAGRVHESYDVWLDEAPKRTRWSDPRLARQSAPATEDMHPDAVYARQWEPSVRGGLDRFGWLIERGQVTGYPTTEWFDGEGWTTDAWSALWFTDRRSAQQFIDQRTTPPGYNPFGVAVEHGFDAARQSAPATALWAPYKDRHEWAAAEAKRITRQSAPATEDGWAGGDSSLADAFRAVRREIASASGSLCQHCIPARECRVVGCAAAEPTDEARGR